MPRRTFSTAGIPYIVEASPPAVSFMLFVSFSAAHITVSKLIVSKDEESRPCNDAYFVIIFDAAIYANYFLQCE